MCFQNVGPEPCLCQLRQYKGDCLLQKAFKMCFMFWRDVMTWFVVSAATWPSTLQRQSYMSGQRPGRQHNTLHLQETLCRVKKQKTKKNKNINQLFSRLTAHVCCVYAIHCKWQINRMNQTAPDLAGTLQEVCGKAQGFAQSQEVNTTC